MDRKRVCVLGNYSGRNAGDAAMLEGILNEVSSQYKDVEFVVPTLNPEFICRSYGEYPIIPVDVRPWKGCVKFLGLPVWKALCSSDLVLITDAILFDRHLLNPMYNYLSSLALLIPQARKWGVPVVLYNVSLGPVVTRPGRWCLRRIFDSADLLILRDDESLGLVEALSPVSAPVLKGADSALSAQPCGDEDTDLILQGKGINAHNPRVGINLNSYGDAFMRDGPSSFSPEQLLSVVAETALWAHQELGADIWLFATQHMDIGILQELQARVERSVKAPLFTNREHTYAELMGLMSTVDLLVGMRTHSIILASSVGTPVVGIVNYPKTYGYLSRIGQERQAILINQLTFSSLQALVESSWNNRATLRHEVAQAVEGERRLARQAARFLEPYLGAREGVPA